MASINANITHDARFLLWLQYPLHQKYLMMVVRIVWACLFGAVYTLGSVFESCKVLSATTDTGFCLKAQLRACKAITFHSVHQSCCVMTFEMLWRVAESCVISGHTSRLFPRPDAVKDVVLKGHICF